MSTPKVLQRRGRDRIDILDEILETAIGGARKTQIMYDVGLSYANTNAYLSFLLERKLLEVTRVNEVQIFKTNEKGLRFIQAFKNLRYLIIQQKITEALAEKGKNNMKDKISPWRLTTRDELFVVMGEQERILRQINSRISDLERKLDIVHAELKKDKKEIQ